jgi:hypothetical protein
VYSVVALFFACMIAFIVAGGCGRQEPPSPIVQKAQQAGSGDLASASTASIRDWLGKHRYSAEQIEAMCRPIRQNASANWGDSTEGRLCRAAHELAFFRAAPAKGDGRTFRPGLN